MRSVAGALTALVALPFCLLAQQDGREAWFHPSEVSVTMNVTPGDDFLRVTMFMMKGNDARIEVSGKSDGKSHTGSLMIVSGNRMLARNVPMERGMEIDALDGPVLQVRLALELLGRAFPGGPTSVTTSRTVDVTERKESIKVNTASAGGEYPAPWTLKGSGKEEDSRKVFDLVFRCAGVEQVINLKGSWRAKKVQDELPDSLSVTGWRVFAIGPYSRQDGGGTIYDYGAQEIRKTFRTLGEVRQDAARQK